MTSMTDVKDSVRRSQQEHAATLAAKVRRSLRQEAAADALSAESKPPPRVRYGLIASLAALAALAALAVAFLEPSTAPPVAREPVAVLELVQGSVGAYRAAGRPRRSRLLSLEAGEPVLAGAVIETGAVSGAPSSSRAALRLASGASVRLDVDTRARLASSSVVHLERGAVYVDAGGGDTEVEVRTTLGVVRDVGTQFEVRLLEGEASLRVRIREGKVVLRGNGESHEAEAGAELEIDRDGILTRGTVPMYGPHWDWVLDTAPVPEIEGRPLRAFLDWAAREGGWQLRFADDQTAGLASEIVLHGDLHDLKPAEAVAMVLEGSSQEYRLEDGVLIVGPAGFR